MAFSFIAPFIVAGVILVPKAGIDKIKPEAPAQVKPVTTEDDSDSKGKKDGVIILRKVAKEKRYKFVKTKSGKTKKVFLKESQPKTDFEEENLDAIYKKEREYFNNNRGASRRKKSNKEVVASSITKSERGPASVASSDSEDTKKILKKIESKYITHFVKIDVVSEVTQALLERTKSYTGKLYIAPGSRFKMDMKKPNKHMLLMDGKNIWVVDYPLDGTHDKVQILHSKSAKNLKNQAFLDIFSGVGNLQKSFKIESSDKKNDEITYKLIPKEKDAQVERVELKINVQRELISSITFWDTLGNKTQLKLSEQKFSDDTPKDIFQFTPPKDAAITYL